MNARARASWPDDPDAIESHLRTLNLLYYETYIKEASMPPRISRDQIERAARIYVSNQDAGMALGIAPGTFGRLCRRYGIPTPQERRRKRREAAS